MERWARRRRARSRRGPPELRGRARAVSGAAERAAAGQRGISRLVRRGHGAERLPPTPTLNGRARGTLPRARSAALAPTFYGRLDGRNQEKRDKMHEAMSTVKAHVRNGFYVSDEPAAHPEGTPVELQLVTTDPWAGMDPEERAEIEEGIEE